MYKECTHNPYQNCVHKTIDTFNTNPNPTQISTFMDKKSEDAFEALKKAFSEKLPLVQNYVMIEVDKCSTYKQTAELLKSISPPPKSFGIRILYEHASNVSVLKAVAKLLSYEDRAIDVDLRYATFSKASFTIFCNALRTNSTIRSLTVPLYGFDLDEFNEAMIELLTNNKILTSIHYEGANGSAKKIDFCSALAVNTTFQFLSFSGTLIEEGGWKKLASALTQNYGLEKLFLSSSNLRTDSREIFESLSHHQTLTHLLMEHANIDSEGLATFGNMLKHNNTLEWLSLSNNRFNAESAKLIAEPISLNYGAITFLNLSRCNLKDNAVSIISALSTNKTIETVELSHNQIGYEGAFAVGEMLKKNKTILRLFLMNNPLTENGVLAIAEGMEHNNVLQRLALNKTFDTTASSIITRAFEKLLRVDTPLSILNIGENDIPQPIVETIPRLIQTNSTLVVLLLGIMKMSNAGREIGKITHRNVHNIKMREQTLFGSLLKEISKPPSISFNTNKRIY